VNDIVNRAPAPRTVPPPRGRFPKEYRNEEGPRDNVRRNFDNWETQLRGGAGANNGGNGTLYEYPVKTLRQPAPFSPDFRFNRPAARLDQLRPADANDRRGYMERWTQPRNDRGPIRAVTREDGQVVGAMYHPDGNLRGYERARLAPLDRNGRAEVARHNDRQDQRGRTTWPQRGPEGDWPE
jgi:hypothetical protein